MPNSWRKQHTIEEEERRLHAYRSRCFQVTAKVPLYFLSFEEGFRSWMNNHENVTRLEKLMKTQGCQRLMRENHVPVIVSSEDWMTKVVPVYENSGVVLDVPHLQISPGYRLRALDHESLINAAQIRLKGPDQWWIVDVYVLDTDSGDAAGIIQQRFVRSLKERIPNDLSPPDGLAYERINYYEGHLDGHINRSAADDWWAALNTKTRSSKEKGLRNFFRNAKLHNKLNALLAIRGLWEAMRIGVLHKITAMHCDEAICCYWEHILQTFLRIVGGRQQLLPYIDGVTVELLDSRAPKVSMRDRQFLQKQMDDGQLFANLDNQVRDEVWQNLLGIDYPIPTLKTFFKDRLYLEVAQNVMKQALLPVPNDTATTIDAGLCATWESARSGTIPVRQERLKEGLLELWRFSFQYGFEMTGHTRLRSDKQVPQDEIEAAELWRHFFALMRIRGFKAPDGDSAAAPTMSLPTPPPCEFPENPEHEIEAPKRCGKPYSFSARADRFALAASSMRQRSVPNRVTAGFLRQSVFNAFFSYLQTTSTGTNSTTYEVPLQEAQVEVELNQPPLGSETVSPVNGHDQPSESTSNEPSSWDTTPGRGLISDSAYTLSSSASQSQSSPVIMNFNLAGLSRDQQQLQMPYDFEWIHQFSTELDANSFGVEIMNTGRSIPPQDIFDYYSTHASSQLVASLNNEDSLGPSINNKRKREHSDDAGNNANARAKRFIEEQALRARDRITMNPASRHTSLSSL